METEYVKELVFIYCALRARVLAQPLRGLRLVAVVAHPAIQRKPLESG